MPRKLGAGGAFVLLLVGQIATAEAQADDSCTVKKDKTVTIINNQSAPATVFINFGAESALNSKDLSFCQQQPALNCQFRLGAKQSQEITNPQKKKLVMSLAFNKPVTCGSTKAEITVNNPDFCDNADVSVVDGFNERIQIKVDTPPNIVLLGPPKGLLGNQQVFGVFPYGCDRCAASVSPQRACGPYPPNQCHAGTEHRPDPVCQWQINQPKGRVDIVLLSKEGQ